MTERIWEDALYSDLIAALEVAFTVSKATHQVRYVVNDGGQYRIKTDATLSAQQPIEATVYAYDAEPWKRNRKV